ncbi:hypothetical protein PVL30_005496 [Lodderomyces elongisporus]|uniref:uncharacterized protein n=1 Tax=Lodderomyces elongisporus TaxID=36914 RepID=UPI0029240409|nr:uncharacterized protein PVL30_005496 [Lodderomyces elongisporus]WLF81696.1 hypothetical protein PVL30_005496 [Lodderomyces elongisporus]
MSVSLDKEAVSLDDLEKSTAMLSSTSGSLVQDNYQLHPSSKHILKRLYIALLIEATASLTIYYHYANIGAVSPMLAPTILGCSSGALAQSINQFQRRKFTINKILKFMIWGSINGYFTVAWINILMNNFDSLVYRILVDQAIGAPIFQLIFNILNTLWDSGELFSKSTRNSYIKSLKYSYCYWPFFSVFSFMFVPHTMMFPCNCLANLIWNIILSKLA